MKAVAVLRVLANEKSFDEINEVFKFFDVLAKTKVFTSLQIVQNLCSVEALRASNEQHLRQFLSMKLYLEFPEQVIVPYFQH